MGVSIVATPGADYVWNGVDFAWDSAEGGKAWADASATVFAATADNGLNMVSGGSRLPLIASGDGFAFDDVRRQMASAVRAEAIGFAETYIDLIAFVLSVSEALAVTEAAPRAVQPRPHNELLGIGEAALRDIVRSFASALVLADTRAGQGLKVAADPLAILDAASRATTLARTTALALAEARATTIARDARQALAMAETYTDLIAFVFQIVEALGLAQHGSNTTSHVSAEEIALRDRLLRAAEAVIADLAFRATPLDEAGFAVLVAESRPLGFSAFRDLVPGDYEYAKALVRLILEAPVTTANRVALSEVLLNIDVPDVRDRGMVAVPIGGAVVPFNRTFNAAPEIQATFKGGGTLAIPQIGTITATGFHLTLVNPDTQGSVAGNASWSAEGY